MRIIRIRPRTAIAIIETFYLLLILFFLFLVLLVILFFRWWIIVAAIAGLVEIIIIANKGKLQFINYCLRHDKYPHELLAVLQQLELTDKLDEADGLVLPPDKQQFNTTEFLADNKLKAEIGKRNYKFPFAIYIMIAPLILLAFFIRVTSFNEDPYLFVVLGVVLVLGVFFWIRTKDNNNEEEYMQAMLIFNEKGLQFEGQLYKWTHIRNWIVKGQTKSSYGKMYITYSGKEMEDTKVIINLNDVDIDRINFMLMMAHYKAKYDSQQLQPAGESQ